MGHGCGCSMRSAGAPFSLMPDMRGWVALASATAFLAASRAPSASASSCRSRADCSFTCALSRRCFGRRHHAHASDITVLNMR